MEGTRKSPSSGAAAVAGEGNAATRRARIEDQQQQGEGLAAAVAGMKRKRDAVAGDGGGSQSAGEQSSQLSPMLTVAQTPTPTNLQALANACRAVFKGTATPPTNDAVYFICRVMDRIGIFDVGLMDEIGFFHHRNFGPQNPPVLTCKIIHNCANNFMVAVLYLPKGAVMPLHDHPGMIEFTKLLVGSAHVEAYDWVLPRVSAAGSGSTMLANKVRDDDLKERFANAWVLLPGSGGNMSRFVAGQDGPCVFLKVFTPLYSTADPLRGYTFYQYLPYKFDLNVLPNEVTEEMKRKLPWVRKIDEPKDVIKIVNLPYRGPPIV